MENKKRMTQKEHNMKGPLRVSYINTPFIITIESRERERERGGGQGMKLLRKSILLYKYGN